MDKQTTITTRIAEAIATKKAILEDRSLLSTIESAVDVIIDCYEKGGKVLLCGNGGSAADAQHLASELSGRFYINRAPLHAEALHVNTSYITAVANDYSYDDIYARSMEAKGKSGDVLIAISTSGNSLNVVRAVQKANEIGVHTIGLLGGDGGKIKSKCLTSLVMPSDDTPRIQEAHILVGHIICEIVEAQLFGDKKM